MMSAHTATAVTVKYISASQLLELSSEEIAKLLEIESSEAALEVPSPQVAEGESIEIYISQEGLQKLSSAELKDLLK